MKLVERYSLRQLSLRRIMSVLTFAFFPISLMLRSVSPELPLKLARWECGLSQGIHALFVPFLKVIEVL